MSWCKVVDKSIYSNLAVFCVCHCGNGLTKWSDAMCTESSTGLNLNLRTNKLSDQSIRYTPSEPFGSYSLCDQPPCKGGRMTLVIILQLLCAVQYWNRKWSKRVDLLNWVAEIISHFTCSPSPVKSSTTWLHFHWHLVTHVRKLLSLNHWVKKKGSLETIVCL